MRVMKDPYWEYDHFLFVGTRGSNGLDEVKVIRVVQVYVSLLAIDWFCVTYFIACIISSFYFIFSLLYLYIPFFLLYAFIFYPSSSNFSCLLHPIFCLHFFFILLSNFHLLFIISFFLIIFFISIPFVFSVQFCILFFSNLCFTFLSLCILPLLHHSFSSPFYHFPFLFSVFISNVLYFILHFIFSILLYILYSLSYYFFFSILFLIHFFTIPYCSSLFKLFI